jgi:hypothetical protein
LVPKVIALASATKAAGPAVVTDEAVVVTSDVSSLLSPLHPAPNKARRPSGTTCFFTLLLTAGSGATGMGGSSVDSQDRSDSEEERVTQQMAPTLY